MKSSYCRVAALLFTLVATACSRQPHDDAVTTAQALSDAGGGSGSVACALFTAAQVGERLGTTVSAGTPWGMTGTGCQWSSDGDDENAVQVVIVDDPRYWENLARADGGEALRGIGDQAFVAPWLGAYRAGALTPSGSIYVMTPRRDLSVALLRDALTRWPPS
jgi:hypothetical protein